MDAALHLHLSMARFDTMIGVHVPGHSRDTLTTGMFMELPFVAQEAIGNALVDAEAAAFNIWHVTHLAEVESRRNQWVYVTNGVVSKNYDNEADAANDGAIYHAFGPCAFYVGQIGTLASLPLQRSKPGQFDLSRL